MHEYIFITTLFSVVWMIKGHVKWFPYQHDMALAQVADEGKGPQIRHVRLFVVYFTTIFQ
jgi:hypothetical protein